MICPECGGQLHVTLDPLAMYNYGVEVAVTECLDCLYWRPTTDEDDREPLFRRS